MSVGSDRYGGIDMKERWNLNQIGGVIPAMLTPFDCNEEVDIPAT